MSQKMLESQNWPGPLTFYTTTFDYRNKTVSDLLLHEICGGLVT